MSDLESYLNSSQYPQEPTIDAFFAHVMYNLAAKEVDQITTQRIQIDLLNNIVIELNRIRRKNMVAIFGIGGTLGIIVTILVVTLLVLAVLYFLRSVL